MKLWSENAGRAVVYSRSGGRCEVCTRPAAEWHHRANRSQGGTWAPGNGLHLCSWCHGWITEHPAYALLLGIGSLPGHSDPTTIPTYVSPLVLWRAWWIPDDDGCWAFADEPPEDHPQTPDRLKAVAALSRARNIA